MKKYLFAVGLFSVGCLAQAAAPPAPDASAAAPSHSSFLHTVISAHFVPYASAFARTAPRLVQAVDSLCDSPDSGAVGAARMAWVDTLLAWEAVNAIAIGPTLERRSAFRIDFWPVRVSLLEFAIREVPATTAELDRVSAPAKGLPALEWLLWSSGEAPAITADARHCGYARILAQGIAEEAQALEHGFEALAERDFTDEYAADLFAELINQTFGGVEHLRRKKMEKPATIGSGKNFPRLLSGQTAKAWSAHWLSLQAFLLGGAGVKNASLDAYLRARGLVAESNKLRAATREAAQSMRTTQQATPALALRAAKSLATLKTVLEDDVAGALQVTVGFNDNDGD